ncbi:MAG: hypothetical protein ACMUJM_25610 [bacterium]
MGNDVIQKRALEAIEDNSVNAFIENCLQSEWQNLREWLNDEILNMHVFLSIALEIFKTKRVSLLSPAKLHIIGQYVYLSEVLDRELQKEPPPIKPSQSPIQILNTYEQKKEINPFLAAEATRLVLMAQVSGEFFNGHHRSLFEYHLIKAGRLPYLDEVVTKKVSIVPEIFSDPMIVSNLAVSFGPRIISIYLKALSNEEEGRECIISEVSFFTGITNQGNKRAYIQVVKEWYSSNQDYLYLNTDLLFPAPDYGNALFEIDYFAKFVGRPRMKLYGPDYVPKGKDELYEIFKAIEQNKQEDLANESHNLRERDFPKWLSWISRRAQKGFNL